MELSGIAIALVTGLIVNGLNTLISYGIRKRSEATIRKDNILEALGHDTDLVLKIQDVLANISKAEPFSSNRNLTTKLRSFLESTTAESIVRQICSDYIIEEKQQESIDGLREEFQVCFAAHLGVKVQDVKQIATELFRVICDGCRKAYDTAINKGILSAHEAKSIARHRVLLDELHAIKSNLEFFAGRAPLALEEINEFKERYRSQVGDRCREITIPHFDRATRVEIDKIFVPPNFICPADRKGEGPEIIPLEDFLSRLYRSVLLGDPGGGKSTLAQKICHDLCHHYEERLIGGRLLMPVLIILREYSSKKKRDGSSFIQFMESEVTSKYQLPKAAPPRAFEYLLNNGHLLVIFDGLDELLDPNHRREVSADIESFCNLFPSVPILVTSRVVGYEQAPLNTNIFETFQLAPFNDEQVSEYVYKWFDNDPELAPQERKTRAEAFLEESNIVADLRSNPLMLALMCNLYRGAGFIPRNRPDVYKKCSEMLFERWDPSRGIYWGQLPISEPKVLLSYLAHWFYSDESLQSGVTEDILVKEASRFLGPRRFESEEEAEKASKEFVTFCRGRAWVFTDAGQTPEGRRIYKFTHKTFLEYFAANYIVRNNNTPEKFWNLLSPQIGQRAWDVVAQLAFQILHEQVEGASDAVLTLLLEHARHEEKTRWQYLSFGARCLQFIPFSPKMVRALTEDCVVCMIHGARPLERNHEPRRSSFRADKAPEELTAALLLAAPESQPIVGDSLMNEISRIVEHSDDEQALRAIDLGLMLSFPLRSAGRENLPNSELYNYWNAVKEKIFERVDARLEVLAPYNFVAFLHWFYRHGRPFEKLFEWYTPNHLFLEQGHLIFENIYWMAPAYSLLEAIIVLGTKVEKEAAERAEGLSKQAATVGESLLHKKKPCFSDETVLLHLGLLESLVGRHQVRSRAESKRMPLVQVPIQGDAVFGFWCLYAVCAEAAEREKQEKVTSVLRKTKSPVTKVIADVIEARALSSPPDKILQALTQFDIPPHKLQLVKQWISRQVSFVTFGKAKKT